MSHLQGCGKSSFGSLVERKSLKLGVWFCTMDGALRPGVIRGYSAEVLTLSLLCDAVPEKEVEGPQVAGGVGHRAQDLRGRLQGESFLTHPVTLSVYHCRDGSCQWYGCMGNVLQLVGTLPLIWKAEGTRLATGGECAS